MHDVELNIWPTAVYDRYRCAPLMNGIASLGLVYTMGPHLRVSAGTSRSQLQVIAVNYDKTPLKVSSDAFEGSIAVRIRDFEGEAGQGKESRALTESSYFDTHQNLTWSMAIQGNLNLDPYIRLCPSLSK